VGSDFSSYRREDAAPTSADAEPEAWAMFDGRGFGYQSHRNASNGSASGYRSRSTPGLLPALDFVPKEADRPFSLLKMIMVSLSMPVADAGMARKASD
jgi:hypothetical protein